MWFKNVYGCLAGCIFLLMLTSCQSFYKARTLPGGQDLAGNLDRLKRFEGRYFILRIGGEAFYMDSLKLSQDRKAFTATLDTLPPFHRLHLKNGRNAKKRYLRNNVMDFPVLSEVHLYLSAVTASAGQPITVPLHQVQKIEVLEKDKSRTTTSHLFGGFVGGLAVVLGVLAISVSGSSFFR